MVIKIYKITGARKLDEGDWKDIFVEMIFKKIYLF